MIQRSSVLELDVPPEHRIPRKAAIRVASFILGQQKDVVPEKQKSTIGLVVLARQHVEEFNSRNGFENSDSQSIRLFTKGAEIARDLHEPNVMPEAFCGLPEKIQLYIKPYFVSEG